MSCRLALETGVFLSIAISTAPALLGLSPSKAITQYTRTVWTQAEGLPQDTIRAITQTADGYLWLGTDEGLTRFDGYDFVTFTKDSGALPINSITVLAAGRDGTLWIGTPNGLTCYHDGNFTTYTTKDGLPSNFISSLYEDYTGVLWVASGVSLSRFEYGKFTTVPAASLQPIRVVRLIYEDRDHTLWIAGVDGVVKRENGRFVPVLGAAEMDGLLAIAMLRDRQGALWMGGSLGVVRRTPDGKIRRFNTRDGLPELPVRALWEDRAGNLWAGTNGGLSRFEDGRFVPLTLDSGHKADWVRCIFEDSEGDLWVGMNNGLNRLRDDRFAVYGRMEGLPSDEPTTVHQDRRGQIWIGYHDAGLVAFQPGPIRAYGEREGLSEEVLSIRDARNGDLLVSNRHGLARMHDGRFTDFRIPDSQDRVIVFDALEDQRGRIWAASPAGVNLFVGTTPKLVIPGGQIVNGAFVVLAESAGGAIWAGSFGEGLWRVDPEGAVRRFTTADGLGSDQIRALRSEPDGTLWIGTFGGGLAVFRNGSFFRYKVKDGLLSDNISHIEDDGAGSLWLATTRGICRVSKRQLRDFSERRIAKLTPENYGVEDGLRSAQCAPGYPASGGGTRTADGRLWFPTTNGVAVIDPNAPERPAPPPSIVHVVDVIADGKDVNLLRAPKLKPGPGDLQFRYTAIHLSAPELVRFEYKLEGLDRDWVSAAGRRVINYNSLRHGQYRFVVRASLPGGHASETSFGFEILPHFYERNWFLWLCVATLLAGIYGAYQVRLKQIRSRFSLVLEERARMAREIHDTLAQGFVGISSQLDAMALQMNGDASAAGRHLEMAQRMARHSLTEARRSVMDLRASALEHHGLPSALSTAARNWSAGSAIPVEIDISGEEHKLPEDVEQNVLRIAQEAVTNALKHSSATHIWIRLRMEARKLLLEVRDDGRGFELSNAFSTVGGHFGLLGMRERAERLGGALALSSDPNHGTRVEVNVPLS